VADEDGKSRRSEKVNSEVKSRRSAQKDDSKSKYSDVILYDEVKSKKSNAKSNMAPPNEETKSRRSHASVKDEEKSVHFLQEE